MKKRPAEVRIEPIEMKHAPFIQRYAAEADIAATRFSIPHPLPENWGEEFVRGVMRRRAEGSAFVYAVYDNETFVGECGVGLFEERAYLAYWIGKPFWGQGYGTAAAFAVLKRFFSEQGYPLISAGSYTHNPASIRILEKCGFQYERTEQRKRGAVNWYLLKRGDFNRIVQTRERSGDET